ncbi:MAG TPA: SDR family oxidoreductase [Oligoflexia bacterium]|nr:SDR family oxidoreductase [Oligoflexia bacterium]HMP26661.1 SDR family oxidoreductase [Oligoflexia bacterium]
MKRIAITGGAGFIGSHLTDRLLEKGCEVLAIDNLYTGDKRNIERHLNNPRFDFIRHDIIDPIKLEVEHVYHLACPASPTHYQSNPVKTIKTNVLGTLNMLGLCKRVGARFLLASTSEVYGDPLVHPQVESYWGNVNPVGPRSCYDEGKRVAESLTINYANQKNPIETRIVRIFNTYGPRMMFNDGRVVSNFILQALQGDPLTVYGDGSQTRSFCYVDDLVAGLIAAMEQDNFAGPVNLGNPSEFTVLELARKVIELTNSSSKIIYKPLPQDDPTRRCPDITLAKNHLNWTPKVSLEEGLKKTIDDFKKRIGK